MAKQTIGRDYREVLAELKQKIYKPVYFLTGEEPYYIDLISNYIEQNVLKEEEKIYNQYILYGKDTSMKAIIEKARQYPMMAQNQVIIVKEAQNISSFDDLSVYLQHPQPSTILVFCCKYKKLDGRKKFVTDVNTKGVLVNSEKMYDNQLPSFIQGYMMEKNVRMDDRAVQLLAEHIGNDLQRLANELDKLIMTKPANVSVIDSDLVQKNVGISKEFNVFELKSALIEKNVYKSNWIATHLSKQKGFAINAIIPTLYQYFSNLMLYYYIQDKSPQSVAVELKINPYFAKEYALGAKNYNAWKTMSIISILRTYDAKSKGIGNNTNTTPSGELLKELVYHILH